MTTAELAAVKQRFLATLRAVKRPGRHLAFSWRRLFDGPIDAEWVRGLDADPERAERLEAFVSRFGRMQDTMANKLPPRWFLAQAARPGSLIESLDRAERLGVIGSVDTWLEARKLRILLIHEYMEDRDAFAADLALARDRTSIMFDAYHRLLEHARERLCIAPEELPAMLAEPWAGVPNA